MPLLSDKSVIRRLMSLMQAHGVTRCVLCPGSRNAPLTASFSALFECRNATDERSAGFAALGWAAQTGEPVAVCVTSGSALLNLHPAVAEAYYRRVPLLVISADRPAAMVGQQDGQTLPQPGAFGPLVRYAAQVPEEEALYSNRLINEALLALRAEGGGPVHLNLPLTEPFFGMSEGELPAERVIRRSEISDTTDLTALLARYPRRLLLAGQLPQDNVLPLPPTPFWQSCAVAGDHLSPARQLAGCTLLPPDAPVAALEEDEAAALVPDILITFGGCIVSKHLKALFRKHAPREHWHISPDGAIVDTFGCLTRVLKGEAGDFLRLFADAPAGDAAFAERWSSLTHPLNAHKPPLGYHAAALVHDTLRALPPQSVLHLANSSALRYADMFPLPADTRVECNRGVNGIEGSLSAAVGFAAGDERLNLLIIGDLSFFYDMNALWLPGIRPNLRILLLNNGGGSIFKALPGIPQAAAVCAPHESSAAAWAESRGFTVLRVSDADSWQQALPQLLAPDAPAPVLVEAMTNADADAAAYRALLHG